MLLSRAIKSNRMSRYKVLSMTEDSDANKKNFQIAFHGWVNSIQRGVLQLAPPLKLWGEL